MRCARVSALVGLGISVCNGTQTTIIKNEHTGLQPERLKPILEQCVSLKSPFYQIWGTKSVEWFPRASETPALYRVKAPREQDYSGLGLFWDYRLRFERWEEVRQLELREPETMWHALSKLHNDFYYSKMISQMCTLNNHYMTRFCHLPNKITQK